MKKKGLHTYVKKRFFAGFRPVNIGQLSQTEPVTSITRRINIPVHHDGSETFRYFKYFTNVLV